MIKNTLVALSGILSLVYIINPGAGIFELIPDNIPFLGNVDEALATTLLINALRYYGVNLTSLFKK